MNFDKINEDKFLFYNKNLLLITIYDDWFYSRNDYDHLCPNQRNYLDRFLSDQGFQRKSGQRYEKDRLSVGIIKSLSLGVSPLDETKRSLEKFDYLAVSPMGYYLYVLDINADQSILKQLAQKCPINLLQAKDLSNHESFYEELLRIHPILAKIQNETKEVHKFKRLR